MPLWHLADLVSGVVELSAFRLAPPRLQNDSHRSKRKFQDMIYLYEKVLMWKLART